MSKKSVLSESTIRRFMKLSSLDNLSRGFLQERTDEDVQEEELKLEEEKEDIDEAKEEVEEGKDLTAQGGNKETGATQSGDPAAGKMKALKEDDTEVQEEDKGKVQKESGEKSVTESIADMAPPSPEEEDPMATSDEELPMEDPADEGGIDSAAVAGALQTLADALKAAGVDVQVTDNTAEDPAGEEDMAAMPPAEDEEPAMELAETEKTKASPTFDIDSLVNNIAESVMSKLAVKSNKK